MDSQILEEIGFTKGEVKAYFALMELGESTIGPISKKAGITAAKTYPILEKLKEKGLITTVIKSGTKHFQILNSERIIDFLESKEKKIDEQKKEIKNLIPTLISHKKEEQYATVYESFNGMKTLYNEILDYLKKEKEDFIGFTLGDEYESKEANLFFKNHDAKRKNMGIKTRLIGIAHQKTFLKKEYGKNSNIEIRYVEQAVPTGLIIYGDNVATLVWNKSPAAFVIHSKENAIAYRKFFKDMWKIAKK